MKGHLRPGQVSDDSRLGLVLRWNQEDSPRSHSRVQHSSIPQILFLAKITTAETKEGYILRYRPKGVFGKGVGNSKNASEMRQKCIKNASKWVLFCWEKRTFQNVSEMRQKCAEHLWGRTPFGRYWILRRPDSRELIRRIRANGRFARIVQGSWTEPLFSRVTLRRFEVVCANHSNVMKRGCLSCESVCVANCHTIQGYCIVLSSFILKRPFVHNPVCSLFWELVRNSVWSRSFWFKKQSITLLVGRVVKGHQNNCEQTFCEQICISSA